MPAVREATPNDADQVVVLQRRLFEEDAAVHDTNVDLSWAEREGLADILGLIDDQASVVLVAVDGDAKVLDADTVIGFLAGFSHPSSPTRHPVTFAELRSLFVLPAHRSNGVGAALTDGFIGWARTAGCVEVHVSSYVANDRAQVFYERLGFAPRSLSRALIL